MFGVSPGCAVFDGARGQYRVNVADCGRGSDGGRGRGIYSKATRSKCYISLYARSVIYVRWQRLGRPTSLKGRGQKTHEPVRYHRGTSAKSEQSASSLPFRESTNGWGAGNAPIPYLPWSTLEHRAWSIALKAKYVDENHGVE